MGINQQRLKIIFKGYANQSDTAAFLGCGYKKAKKIYTQLCLEAEKEGKNIDLGINPKRLMNLLDLNENKIMKYAEEERKNENLQKG